MSGTMINFSKSLSRPQRNDLTTPIKTYTFIALNYYSPSHQTQLFSPEYLKLLFFGR